MRVENQGSDSGSTNNKASTSLTNRKVATSNKKLLSWWSVFRKEKKRKKSTLLDISWDSQREDYKSESQLLFSFQRATLKTQRQFLEGGGATRGEKEGIHRHHERIGW